MYTPRIDPIHVRRLYRISKSRGVFVTTLVNEVIAAYLAGAPDADACPADTSRPRAAGCGQQATEGRTTAPRRPTPPRAADPSARA